MINQSQDNKRIAYNTILLYIRMLFLVLISLYTSRITLQVLGIEDYGINNVVGGIITFLGFMTNSLAGASSRFITFALGKGDFHELKKVFNNIVSIHLLFAIIIFIIGETIGLWFVLCKLNIPESREIAAFWVFQFSILTSMGSFISMPYNAAIIAHEKMSAFAYMSIGDAILKLIAVFFLTISPYDKLILYASFILLIQFFDFIIYIIYCNKKFKETHLSKFKIDKPLFKEIFYYAGWTMNGNLAIFGYTQGLNILLNIFFNPIINAARGIAVQVQNVINNFSYNFQMAINPQITKSYAKNDFSRMHELLIVSSKFSVLLIYLLCLPLIFEARSILYLWLGEYPEHTISFLRLILITSILFTLSNPILTALHATGKLKKFQLIEGSMLLSIVPISFLFLKYGKVEPEIVFVIHIIIEICTQIVRVKIVLPMINLQFYIYLNQVIKPIIYSITTSLVMPTILSLYLQKGFTSFIIMSITCLISTTVCTYVFGCNKDEKRILLNKISHIISKEKIKK